jgi:phytoene synthase
MWGNESQAFLMRQRGRTFYLAAWLLPKDVRSSVVCLYAFCRQMDDLADEARDIESREAAQAELEGWRHWLIAGARGQPPCADLGQPLASVIHGHSIPTGHLVDLLDGLLTDLHGAIRIRDYGDLRRYCYYVASTVGLCMAHIFRSTSPRALDAAAELGIAMQITNILRDVGEDLDRGRIYLPSEELAAFGLDAEELRRLHQESRGPDKRLREFIRFQVDRCHSQYERGMVGIPLLPPRVRPSILLAARMYRAILRSVERNGYDVLRVRATTSPLDKAREAAFACVAVRSWLGTGSRTSAGTTMKPRSSNTSWPTDR